MSVMLASWPLASFGICSLIGRSMFLISDSLPLLVFASVFAFSKREKYRSANDFASWGVSIWAAVATIGLNLGPGSSLKRDWFGAQLAVWKLPVDPFQKKPE